MPLLLEAKAGDKLVINGAVIECIGSGARLRVLNQASVLRQKEFLAETDAVTPAARTYFSLQCAYLLADHRAAYLARTKTFLDQYVAACPSARPIAQAMAEAIAEGNLYQGLKHAQDLLRHESLVINAFAAQLEDREGSNAP